VTTRDGEEFFIAKFDANGAFPGDTVNIRVKKPALGGKKAEAVITNIVKRTQEPLVCVCKKKYKSNELVALPYRSSANTTIVIVGKKERVRSGDIVSVRITSGIDRPVGIIEKYIGNENENDIEERIILIQNNISFKFPDEVIHAADKLHSPKPSQKRLDIRNLFTVTID
jgi:ribonuclease R